MDGNSEIKRPVHLNLASKEELADGVAGLGSVLAQRIVAFREEHGPFFSLEALTAVPGIKERLLARIAPQLTLQEVVQSLESAELSMESAEAGPEDMLSDEQPGQDVAVWEQSLAGPSETTTLPDADLVYFDMNDDEEFEEPIPEEQEAQEDAVGENGVGVALDQAEPVRISEASVEEPIIERATLAPPAVEREVAAPQPQTREEASPAAQSKPPRRCPPFWHSILLVLLGGLLGAGLALLALWLLSGSLQYASRSEMDALSRNLGILHTNQQQAWQRVDQLDGRLAAVEREMGRLDALSAQVNSLERELDGLQSQVDGLQRDMVSLRTDVNNRLLALDKRTGALESGVASLTKSVEALSSAVEELKAGVKRFDTFLSALRDLLVDLQGPGTAPAATPTR
jgi:competence ComEA-like helix-hairpin-helix protein